MTLDNLTRRNVYDKLAEYLVNDEDEYQGIINALIKANNEEPNMLIDYIDEINVWEKIENTFTVKDFCELIGLGDYAPEKKYIIVGDNNFWYSTFTATKQTEIDAAMNEAKVNVNEGLHPELPTPTELFLYEVVQIDTIKL